MSEFIIDKRYKVLSLIGSGGMADVYKAINLSNRRIYAIKMLKAEYSDDAEFLRRFEQEARATLHLSHDNIVRAYGVGQHNGLPYIVLEYIEGQTLKQLIVDNGPLPERTAIGLCCQILDALSAAHSHGIIHRDVKPQNVMITSRGKAKLTDFGIARDVRASTRTFSGKSVLGSVHYISPEQAQGDKVTESSDIYSVGVTLYEMLTGTVPFTADSTVSVALMHLQSKPEPPILRNPSIPPSLNDIVLKAMAKDPTDRYAGAKEMRADLVRSLSDPNGSFARETKADAAKRKKKRMTVYAWFFIGVFIPVCAIVLAYLGFSGGWCGQKRNDEAPASAAPFVSASASPTASPTPVPETLSKADSVLKMNLDDALNKLSGLDYDKIYVSFVYESEGDCANNSVVFQSEYHSEGTRAKTADLTVYRRYEPLFVADVSFNVDVPRSSNARIVYTTYSLDNIPYYIVLYDTDVAAQSGFTLSATVYSRDPVGRSVLLLLNGEQVQQTTVSFALPNTGE